MACAALQSAMASQCRAVAGPATSISSADGSGLPGLSLAPARRAAPCSAPRRRFQVQAMAPKKKLIAYDDDWSKQWFGAGIFAENTESAPVNIIKNLEKKKLLSQVEKSGLLSKAESAGLTLSQIEKLGLLSKAESLGLLSLAEKLATASPPVLASLSLPFFVASVATVVLVPDDSQALVVGQTVVAALFALSAGALFVGSIVLGGLQED